MLAGFECGYADPFVKMIWDDDIDSVDRGIVKQGACVTVNCHTRKSFAGGRSRLLAFAGDRGQFGAGRLHDRLGVMPPPKPVADQSEAQEGLPDAIRPDDQTPECEVQCNRLQE